MGSIVEIDENGEVKITETWGDWVCCYCGASNEHYSTKCYYCRIDRER